MYEEFGAGAPCRQYYWSPFWITKSWQAGHNVRRFGHYQCEVLNGTTNNRFCMLLDRIRWRVHAGFTCLPCAVCNVEMCHHSKESLPPLVPHAQAGRVLGNQLHPPSEPANDMQLPSAIGSPASYCLVPVVQGHNNHLPVEHTYFTLLPWSQLVLLEFTFAFSR